MSSLTDNAAGVLTASDANSSSSRQRVAVIFGGQSSEHGISCLSAASVLAALDRDSWDVIAIGITREGTWWEVSSDAEDWRKHGDQLPEILPTDRPAALPVGDLSSSSLWSTIDVVFPVLHGPFGEDGTIQGALELVGIPFVGSGVLASAAAMDKPATKFILSSANLPEGRFVVATDTRWRAERDAVLAEIATLTFPVFVKPARAGSSVGVSKVHSADDVAAAIEVAREHDPKVIVEQGIENAREVECGVLGGLGLDPARASVCAEIIVADDHEFYDFEAKYLDSGSELVVPARLDPDLSDRLRALAVRAFEVLGCRGLARVDFFVADDGSITINEVNTMPGFTDVSMFPRMWHSTGVPYPQLVSDLLALAMQTSDRVAP